MNRKALAIGINRYPGLDKLAQKGIRTSPGSSEIPARDAENIAQILEQLGNFHPVYRFPQTLITDGKPCIDPQPQDANNSGTAQLKKAILNLFQPSEDIPHTALLFFAGHGIIDNNGKTILATSDAHSPQKDWGISLEWLCDILKTSPVTEQIIWLDCCYSGQILNLADDFLNDPIKRRFIITASLGTEAAYANPNTQQGSLTEIILQGLDPTQHTEGLITNFTLARYLSENIPKTPQKIQIHRGDREILLTCTDRYRLESLLLKQYQAHAKKAPPAPLLTWKYAHSLTGHIDIVKSIAISPDGKLIASGSLDKTIKIWLINTGELLHTIAGHSSAVLSLAFSPDSQTLASASNMESLSATIKLWNVSTGKLQTTLGSSLLALRTSCLAFSPDGLTLASGHLDAKIRLWNLGNCQIRGTLQGHGWDVNSLAFSSDGKILVSGGLDGAIKIWNWHKQELLKTLNRPAPSELIPSLVSWFDSSVGGIWAVAISPDGKIIASGGSEQPINLWDADTGKLLRTLTEHSGSIYTVAFSPDGKTLASGGDDHKIRIWEFQTGKLLETLEHLGPVQSIGFSADGQTLVSGSADATVKIWRRS